MRLVLRHGGEANWAIERRFTIAFGRVGAPRARLASVHVVRQQDAVMRLVANVISRPHYCYRRIAGNCKRKRARTAGHVRAAGLGPRR